ncbi:hypothetical protein F5Y16DRAFT_376324 [Xylariaceae sp. FL0255]|nr:hypothetical protein F5Y16DRAFT_376324 [Xylariaceae sp. FL0255]
MIPQTAAANLPKITALRQQLGYGDVGTNRYNTFIDDVRAFRRKFRTRQGLEGISLYTWNSPEHQSGLSEMVTAYLETDGNGYAFWPDNPSAADGERLQYSRDSAKIKALMKQLFFRLNEQEVRNQKYKNKAKLVPNAEGVNQRGRSTEEPIDVDAIEDGTVIAPKRFADFTQFSPEPVDLGNDRIPSTSTTRRGESKRDRFDLEKEDDYDVPQSPSYDTAKTAKTARRTDTTKVGRQAKRSKTHSASSNRPAKESKAPGPSAVSSTKRKSPRAKRTLQMDGYATGEDYLTVMAAVEPSMASLQDAAPLKNPAPVSITRDGGKLVFRGVHSANPNLKDVHSPRNSSPSIEENPSGTSKSINTHTSSSLAVGNSPPPPLMSRDFTVSTFSPNIDKAPSKPEKDQEKARQTHGPAPSKGPRLEFIYRRVTHIPNRMIRRWYPTRKLEETTLCQFMDDVAAGKDAYALIFRIEVNGIEIVEEIEGGNELQFDQLRKLIKRTIKEELGKRGQTEHPLACVIEIEPVMQNDRMSPSRVDEVEDFTF